MRVAVNTRIDGDILMTTNNEQIIKGSKGGIPVTYERKKPPKSEVSEDVLWKADTITFKNRIGFLTNLSSTFYAIRELFDKESEEYKIITNRLKICSAQQNMEIDKGKGIHTLDIPENWSKWKHVDDSLSEEDKRTAHLYNTILAEKRPQFMRFLYPHFDKEYKSHREKYETLAMNRFGISLDDLITKENKSKDEKKWFDFYFRYGHLVDSESVMNQISRHMTHEISEFKKIKNSNIGWKFNTNKEKQSRMKDLYSKWKKSRGIENNEESLNSEISRMANDISINSNEIAQLALNCSTAFGLSTFPNEVLGLLYKKKVAVPCSENSVVELIDECDF